MSDTMTTAQAIERLKFMRSVSQRLISVSRTMAIKPETICNVILCETENTKAIDLAISVLRVKNTPL